MPSHHRWLHRKVLEADQNGREKRQKTDCGARFWFLIIWAQHSHNTPRSWLQEALNCTNGFQLSFVHRTEYTNQAASSKQTFTTFLSAKRTTLSSASGGCWDEKEYIMTLILWQNKELHQGQCHTVFQMDLHPTHNSIDASCTHSSC